MSLQQYNLIETVNTEPVLKPITNGQVGKASIYIGRKDVIEDIKAICKV